VPYFRAVLADVESRYCVDRGGVLVAGIFSGAWEAELLGCAAADVIRGVGSYSGGLRAHRPACTGPVAAIVMGSTMDAAAPLGPLDPSDPNFVRNDSPGLIPMRDDVLARNGCLGSASRQWNPAFPACVTFIDCPAAFPVVWCELNSSGQAPGRVGPIVYAPGAMMPFFQALPAL
jgi:poly(3-hydroxybutyrate) depolymerase